MLGLTNTLYLGDQFALKTAALNRALFQVSQPI